MLLVRVQRVLRREFADACISTAPPVARASLRIGAPQRLLALVAVACGFPAPEACELACGDDGACPAGFECQASSQLCVPRGTPLACTPREIRPIQPEGDGNDA